MKTLIFDFVLWFLASPILFLLWVVRAIKRVRFWLIAYSPSVLCRNCKNNISLVGQWRCGCGYTYQGHALRRCPICSSIPRTAQCLRCGLTHLLPEEL